MWIADQEATIQSPVSTGSWFGSPGMVTSRSWSCDVDGTVLRRWIDVSTLTSSVSLEVSLQRGLCENCLHVFYGTSLLA